MSYILIIPGEAPTKKNARKESWVRKDERGNFVPLSFPVSWYSKEYTNWAWKTVQYLRAWRNDKHGWLPGSWLTGQYVCTCWFFRSTPFNVTGATGKGSGQKIDLQNLYDSVLDCFAGNSGLTIPKKLAMDHEDYKIISDDSFAFIKSHGVSHIFYDPTNPRTEVYLSPFHLTMITQGFRFFHPDIEPLSYEDAIKEAYSVKYIEKEKRVKSGDIKLDFDFDKFLKGEE